MEDMEMSGKECFFEIIKYLVQQRDGDNKAATVKSISVSCSNLWSVHLK